MQDSALGLCWLPGIYLVDAAIHAWMAGHAHLAQHEHRERAAVTGCFRRLYSRGHLVFRAKELLGDHEIHAGGQREHDERRRAKPAQREEAGRREEVAIGAVDR